MTKIEKQIKSAESITKRLLSKEPSNLSNFELDLLESVLSDSYKHKRDKIEKGVYKEISKNNLSKLINKKKIVKLNSSYYIAAAVSALIFISVGYFLYLDSTINTKPSQFLPGKSLAYLQINNKKTIELEQTKDTVLNLTDSKINLKSETIIYSKNQAKKKQNQLHKITIPRNAEYFIKLSDGTKVWLNAESSIEYYSNFSENNREIKLIGEAFFDVAKDKKRPFIVKTKENIIRVLGTRFNIKAYKNEDQIYTTLEEGSVQLNMGKIRKIMNPNEQIIYNKKSKLYIKKQVNSLLYSAWTRGKFVFKDEPLESILNTLSRWYNIKIFYLNDKVKTEKVSMSLNRYEHIEKILTKLAKTGALNYELKNNALLIK